MRSEGYSTCPVASFPGLFRFRFLRALGTSETRAQGKIRKTGTITQGVGIQVHYVASSSQYTFNAHDV